MKRIVLEYEIVDHGVEHEQYFQGCGTYGTRYDEVFTGVGNTKAEAIEQALEDIAMADIFMPEPMEKEIILGLDRTETGFGDTDEEHHYYASIRVKLSGSDGDGHDEEGDE